MQIVPLCEGHVEEALALFFTVYGEERTAVPELPCLEPRAEEFAGRLAGILRGAPGVAAVEAGRLCGYLAGFEIAGFRGERPGIYSPEWAHAAAGRARGEIYRALYASLARAWVDRGWITHAITLFAHDRAGTDCWFWEGFGLSVIDAVRPTACPPPAASGGTQVRRADPTDVGAILPLAQGLARHLMDSPIFLAGEELPEAQELADWLSEPGHALWIALRNGKPIAYLQREPVSFGAADVVAGQENVAITGAYTRPEARGSGVASLLLEHLLQEARDEGITRCSVDFEAQNHQARRFWLRHFAPIAYSLVRSVDERAAPERKNLIRSSADGLHGSSDAI